MSERKPKLSEILRSLRRQRGWSCTVSERSGLPVSTLSKVENDQLTLSYDKLMTLADGLEVDVAELFSQAPRDVAAPCRADRAAEPDDAGRRPGF